MPYRKIEVDGITYHYTVGRTHVKVRGVGAATIEEVGRRVYVEKSDTNKTAVQPADVAHYIRSRVSS